MENNNQLLLIRVLRIHYKDRLHVLHEALKVIEEYSEKPRTNQYQYNITCVLLRRKFKDLPKEILDYFLSMLPLPKKKSKLYQPKYRNVNVREILLKYLNEHVPIAKPAAKLNDIALEQEVAKSTSSNTVPGSSKQLVSEHKSPKESNKECKNLLDICAEYVTQNRQTLMNHYHTMKDEASKMISSNKYDTQILETLNEVLKDANKKIRWILLLDDEDISDEIILELYGDSDVFMKERHLDKMFEEDPFSISDELNAAIMNFIKK